MKVVYRQPNDTETFDIDRFYKSLNKYEEVKKEAIENAIKKLNRDLVHSSVLVEVGVKLIKDENKAREYFEDHKQKDMINFERLRRITGYLVGSLERWNDGKKAEERERVKHSVNKYSLENKDRIEALKSQEEPVFGKA